jgi:hypothetical protein
MSPWALHWWEWFLLAVTFYFVRKIVYSEHPAGYAIRFCLLVAMFLSVLMGVIQLFRLT